MWNVITLIVILLAVLFQHFWVVISLVYLAAVSNYALSISAAGAEQAAEARKAAAEGNVSKEDLTEHLIEHTSIERLPEVDYTQYPEVDYDSAWYMSSTAQEKLADPEAEDNKW